MVPLSSQGQLRLLAVTMPQNARRSAPDVHHEGNLAWLLTLPAGTRSFVPAKTPKEIIQ